MNPLFLLAGAVLLLKKKPAPVVIAPPPQELPDLDLEPVPYGEGDSDPMDFLRGK